MRYFFILLFLIFVVSIPEAKCASRYEQGISVFKSLDGTVIKVSIDDLFEGECLSEEGKRILLSIKDRIDDNKVIVECFTNRRLNYNASWELADIYAYKAVVFLIRCCGINPQKITYVGYGDMSRFDEEPNRLEFNITGE